MLLVHRYEAPAHSRPPAAACPSSACFNVTGTARTLLTLVPYFVGTRSAACSGHLWLSSLLSCLPFLPLFHALTLLPHSSSLSPHPPYVPLPLPICSSLLSSQLGTSSPLTEVEVVYDNHCLSVRSGPAAPQNPGAFKFYMYLSVLLGPGRARHGYKGSG